MIHKRYLIVLLLVLTGCYQDRTPKENLKAFLKDCGTVILKNCAKSTGGRTG